MSNDPKEFFDNFVVLMNRWELSSYKIISESSSDENKEKIREELNLIFDNCCTKKIRKNDRQASLSCGFPPDYSINDEIEKVISEGNKSQIYVKKEDGLGSQFRYTLIFVSGEWKVDKKERYSPIDEKWIYHSL